MSYQHAFSVYYYSVDLSELNFFFEAVSRISGNR